MSEGKFYEGPYKVLPEVDRLEQKRVPSKGDIIAHRSGAIILRCPKCNAIQFTHAVIVNSPETPTLDRPVHCGSGHCQKCAIWFTIRNGLAYQVDEPKKEPKTSTPTDLLKAGVKKAPPKPEV